MYIYKNKLLMVGKNKNIYCKLLLKLKLFGDWFWFRRKKLEIKCLSL